VLQSNLDPTDPELAVISRTTTEDRLVLFGAKDALGEIAQVQSIAYFAAPEDQSPTYTLLLDNDGRLSSISDAFGRQFVLYYDESSQTATAHYYETGVASEVLTLDFSGAPQAKSRPFQSARDPAGAVEAGPEETTLVIRFFVGLSLGDDGGSYFATVPDASVRATQSDSTGLIIPPGRYEPSEGAYVFDVATRLFDADFEARNCESQLEDVEVPLMLSEYTLGLLFAACATLTGPACHAFFSVAAYAGFTGLLGLHGNLENECAALRRQAQSPSGLVSVHVAASVPRLNWSGEETVQYNALDGSDPVVLQGRVDIRFTIPVSCGGCPDGMVCDGEHCVECVFPNDCAQLPWCTEDGRCVECLLDLHCRGSSHGPFCRVDQCVGCANDQECIDLGLGSSCVAGACVDVQEGTGCTNTCEFAHDGTCDDGGTGSSWDVCFLGTDCADCGVRDVSVCSDTCRDAGDGICDDGGPGAFFAICELGTDCTDCGPRSAP
jgi:hypothetical protein